MYNFNYEYMTFLYVVHVYMFCNVGLYYIALPARVLLAIKIIIINRRGNSGNTYDLIFQLQGTTNLKSDVR